MGRIKLDNLSLVLYQNNKRLTECKPYYIGILGIFIKDCDIPCAVNTRLEIEIMDTDNKSVSNYRFPVVISSISGQGVSLRPDHFEPFHNVRWKTVLNNVASLKNNLEDVTRINNKVATITQLQR
ncbi:MAG: hypothetical protein OEY11_04805 [Gammaproteobacteria bacterium]|nr:hypothetical protein [Gammaproteobacteria bacterium]